MTNPRFRLDRINHRHQTHHPHRTLIFSAFNSIRAVSSVGNILQPVQVPKSNTILGRNQTTIIYRKSIQNRSISGNFRINKNPNQKTNNPVVYHTGGGRRRTHRPIKLIARRQHLQRVRDIQAQSFRHPCGVYDTAGENLQVLLQVNLSHLLFDSFPALRKLLLDKIRNHWRVPDDYTGRAVSQTIIRTTAATTTSTATRINFPSSSRTNIIKAS